jgi:hypothetical protein
MARRAQAAATEVLDEAARRAQGGKRVIGADT